MNLKKKFSVLVIPHQTGKIFTVKVSFHLFLFLFIAFVILSASNLFLSLNASSRVVDKLKLNRLQKENKYLQEKLDELNSVTEELKVQMEELIDKEKKVRMVFGLPQVDEQIRELGVGGPTLTTQFAESPEAGEISLTESELEKLLRQTRFERENFDQIYAILSDKKKILDHTPSIKPAEGYLSCGFGIRRNPFTGRRELHRGVDLAADIGTPVYATADGIVSFVGRDIALGKLVKITHLDRYTTVYGHLSRIGVKRGQRVKRGDIIGAVGNTGYSTGPHLHYEVYRLGQVQNPLKYFLANRYVMN